MESTIKAGFAALLRNLEITGLQETTVSARQQNVRAAVANHLDVLDSFLTGSYRRSTMISPLRDADVDIFVVLSSSYFEQQGQPALLDRVKNALLKSYTATDISRNGQAVTIAFSDFRVDVVPAFSAQGGGYLIPDSPGRRWIQTDPKAHVDAMSASNKQHDGNLVPLVKMLKGWNRANGQSLRSFHLEMLVRQVTSAYKIEYWEPTLSHVFQQMRQLVGQSLLDPAGFGDPIGTYLDTWAKQEDVRSRMQTAQYRVDAARDLASSGKVAAAFDKWRLVFGDYFPAYG